MSKSNIRAAASGSESPTDDWESYKRLLSYVRPYWALFALAVFGFLIGSGAEAYFVMLFGDVVDSWETALSDASWMIPAMMFAAALARGLGEIVGELLLSQISFGVVHKIRTELFGQLLLMPRLCLLGVKATKLFLPPTHNRLDLRLSAQCISTGPGFNPGAAPETLEHSDWNVQILLDPTAEEVTNT